MAFVSFLSASNSFLYGIASIPKHRFTCVDILVNYCRTFEFLIIVEHSVLLAQQPAILVSSFEYIEKLSSR